MVELTGFGTPKKPKDSGLIKSIYEGHGDNCFDIKTKFPTQITRDPTLHENTSLVVTGSCHAGAAITLIRKDFSPKESPQTPYNLDTYFVNPESEEWQKMEATQQGGLHKAQTLFEGIAKAVKLTRTVLEIPRSNPIFEVLEKIPKFGKTNR